MERGDHFSSQRVTTSKFGRTRRNPNSKFVDCSKEKQRYSSTKEKFVDKRSNVGKQIDNRYDPVLPEMTPNRGEALENTVTKLLGYPSGAGNINPTDSVNQTSGSKRSQHINASSPSWDQADSGRSEASQANPLRASDRISEHSHEGSDSSISRRHQNHLSPERGLNMMSGEKPDRDDIREIYNKARKSKHNDIKTRQDGAPVLRPHPLDIALYYRYLVENSNELFKNSNFTTLRPTKRVNPEVVHFENCEAYTDLLRKLKPSSAFRPMKKAKKIKYYRGQEKIDRLRKGLPTIEKGEPNITMMMPNLFEKEVLGRKERLILGAINDASKIQYDTKEEFQAIADKLKHLFDHEVKEKAESQASILNSIKTEIKDLRQELKEFQAQKLEEKEVLSKMSNIAISQSKPTSEDPPKPKEETKTNPPKLEQKPKPKVVDPFSQEPTKNQEKEVKEEAKNQTKTKEDKVKSLLPIVKEKENEEGPPSVNKLENNDDDSIKESYKESEDENQRDQYGEPIVKPSAEEEKKVKTTNIFAKPTEVKKEMQSSPNFAAKDESKSSGNKKPNPFLANSDAKVINKFSNFKGDATQKVFPSKSNTNDRVFPFSNKNREQSSSVMGSNSNPFTGGRSGPNPFDRGGQNKPSVFPSRQQDDSMEEDDSGNRYDRNRSSHSNFGRANPFGRGTSMNSSRDRSSSSFEAPSRSGIGFNASRTRNESSWNRNAFDRSSSRDSGFRLGRNDSSERNGTSNRVAAGGLFAEVKRNPR
ncbi:unnamed protein product [Moneuplotes crassus]|uniref:Uncharacterized protein n=1 Tax=Euplotes crassus TaxID=5936 RepID=A0AAD1Y0Z4_EUPCR|nr:unnamed protein product [Moneuplotes crassus]